MPISLRQVQVRRLDSRTTSYKTKKTEVRQYNALIIPVGRKPEISNGVKRQITLVGAVKAWKLLKKGPVILILNDMEGIMEHLTAKNMSNHSTRIPQPSAVYRSR